MTTEIVVVIDKSGSMQSLANDTIGGYNKFLEDQIRNEIDANISVLLFDTEHKWFQGNVPLNKAKKLDRDNYSPSGGTSLNDAIGRAWHVLEFKNPEKAIVVIITDGEENSSRELVAGAAKEMLSKMQKRDWRIVYLAANQDAFSTAKTYGINLQGVANIAPTSSGIQSAYFSASNSVSNYASGGTRGLVGTAQALVDAFKTTSSDNVR